MVKQILEAQGNEAHDNMVRIMSIPSGITGTANRRSGTAVAEFQTDAARPASRTIVVYTRPRRRGGQPSTFRGPTSYRAFRGRIYPHKRPAGRLCLFDSHSWVALCCLVPSFYHT